MPNRNSRPFPFQSHSSTKWIHLRRGLAVPPQAQASIFDVTLAFGDHERMIRLRHAEQRFLKPSAYADEKG